MWWIGLILIIISLPILVVGSITSKFVSQWQWQRFPAAKRFRLNEFLRRHRSETILWDIRTIRLKNTLWKCLFTAGLVIMLVFD